MHYIRVLVFLALSFYYPLLYGFPNVTSSDPITEKKESINKNLYSLVTNGIIAGGLALGTYELIAGIYGNNLGTPTALYIFDKETITSATKILFIAPLALVSYVTLKLNLLEYSDIQTLGNKISSAIAVIPNAILNPSGGMKEGIIRGITGIFIGSLLSGVIGSITAIVVLTTEYIIIYFSDLYDHENET